jgi:hypothetical protein
VLTQSLTEMNTRIENKTVLMSRSQLAHKADNFTTVGSVGSSVSHKPVGLYGLVRR